MVPNTTTSQVHYWLDMLSGLAPKATVLPVLNRLEDHNYPYFAWEEQNYRRKYKFFDWEFDLTDKNGVLIKPEHYFHAGGLIRLVDIIESSILSGTMHISPTVPEREIIMSFAFTLKLLSSLAFSLVMKILLGI